MSLDLTAYAAMLKKMYPQSRVQELFFKRFPLLGLLEKRLAPGPGASLAVAAIISGTNNRSADFATMLANDSSVNSVQFNITVSNNFNRALVDHKTMLSSKNNVQAFANSLDTAIDGCFRAMKRDIAHSMYRSSSGVIGEVSSINNSTKVLTFASRYSLRNIEPGTRLSASANANLSSPDTTILQVSKVDRELGTVTFTGDASAGTAWATSHYVFVAGDANAKFKGLSDWLPSGAGRAAALSAAFFGVTRDIDSLRLGGIEFDGTSMSTSDALMMASSRLYEEESEPDVCLMNPTDYANLSRDLAGRAVCSNITGQVAHVGYEGIKVHGMVGNVTILPDPDCPPGLCYMLDTKTWKIAHLGKEIVNTWNEDGVDVLRSPNSNDLDIRIYSYMQPYCEAPGLNGVIRLAQ